jgi:DNA-binding NtrC family response regulator
MAGTIETMDSSGSILIADTDETTLAETTDLLQKEGFQCTPVQDGFEALRELEANHYDLLITEIQMPGNEALELVKATSGSTPLMPVIIFSAHPSLESAIASIQLPVTAYLVRPVQPSVLLQHVRMSIADYKVSRSREALLEHTMVFIWAIEETIQVLTSTRSSFKSKRLASLRRKLEQILAARRPE